MNPKLIPHHQINKSKWDTCIRQSTHPLITAQSWYLDIVAPEWNALVADDYNAVMPLPVVKKWRFRFLIQPLLVQQLGIFSTEPLSTRQTDSFYRIVKSMYPFLHLNAYNHLPQSLQLTQRINYTLSLNQNFSSLMAGFSKNCRRNIKKAETLNLVLTDRIDTDTFIEFSRNHASYQFPPQGWNKLRQIIDSAIARNCGFSQAVTDDQNNLLAVAFFLINSNRITFLSGTSSPKGFQKKAMFLIIHQTIKTHCTNNLTLDFEGSEMNNIARFYRGFGSLPEFYYQWTHPLTRFILQLKNNHYFCTKNQPDGN